MFKLLKETLCLSARTHICSWVLNRPYFVLDGTTSEYLVVPPGHGSDVLFSRIPNPQRSCAPPISVCLCILGGGWWKRSQTRLIKPDLSSPFSVIPPPIFVASDTFGPIFHADMVQARLISLCDRCDGDSSAVIIETQPPLWRIAGYLSFMQRKEGRKTNNHRCMDLCSSIPPPTFPS